MEQIVDDPRGERHCNIVCGDCRSKVIKGMRWKCIDCQFNFCTSCYMKEEPHNNGHNKFQRVDNDRVIDP